eukprot:10875779-Ditylum_brightwellii.AAC.1
MPPMTPKPPKTTHLAKNNKKTQQSALWCLCRHQQDTIILSPLPPWQRIAVVRHWCHSPGPKTRKWHQRRRWSAARAKPQQATLPPYVINALGAQFW